MDKPQDLHTAPRLRWTLDQFLAVGAIALALFAAVGSLTWPLGDDQEIFAWAGSVVRDGGVPYKDAWDIKGPLTYYVYATSLALFGHNEAAFRLLDLAILVPFCYLLRRSVIAVTAGSAVGGNFAVAFFALTYYGTGVSETAQPDGWGGMLIFLAMAVMLDARAKPRFTMVTTGCLIACATLLKPTFLIYLLLPCVYCLRHPSPVAQRLILLLQCFGACTVVLAISFGLLFYALGGSTDFFDILHFLITSHVSEAHRTAGLRYLLSGLFQLNLVAPLLVAVIGLFSLNHLRALAHTWLLATWLALTLIAVIAQGWYFTYHFIPVTIATAYILGPTVAHLRESLVTSATPSARTLGGIALSVLLLVLLAAPARKTLDLTYDWPSYALARETRTAYVTHLMPPDLGYWPDLERLAAYLASHTRRTDTVLMWGWDPIVNFLSDRRAPTRFGYTYPVVVQGPLRAKYRDLFITEIRRRPPAYIVADVEGPWAQVGLSGSQLINQFPELDRFLESHYAPVGRVAKFEVLRRIR